YTDNVPINTPAFPSKWELAAASEASLIDVLADEAVDTGRLAVVGYGECQPLADNDSIEGRNANRRVLLVILAAPQGVDALPDEGPEIALTPDVDGSGASMAGTTGDGTDADGPAAHAFHAGAH